MKRTYRLLGCLKVAIGAYAFVNANNANLQAKQRRQADRLRSSRSTYVQIVASGAQLQNSKQLINATAIPSP